jgi:hypothetical protein
MPAASCGRTKVKFKVFDERHAEARRERKSAVPRKVVATQGGSLAQAGINV